MLLDEPHPASSTRTDSLRASSLSRNACKSGMFSLFMIGCLMRQAAATVMKTDLKISRKNYRRSKNRGRFPVATNARRFRVFSLNINLQSPMSAVLEHFSGAQRALFRRYHIGGCSSCGFQPTETLAEVCTRNGNLDVAEVLAHIQSSHEQDAKVLISPKELAELLQQDKSVKLVDVRSREEFEAVHIAGSVLLSQDVMRDIMASGSNKCSLVVIYHPS